MERVSYAKDSLDEPTTFEEALNYGQQKWKWEDAMTAEMHSLMMCGSWSSCQKIVNQLKASGYFK